MLGVNSYQKSNIKRGIRQKEVLFQQEIVMFQEGIVFIMARNCFCVS